jgi:hypothetical protein
MTLPEHPNVDLNPLRNVCCRRSLVVRGCWRLALFVDLKDGQRHMKAVADVFDEVALLPAVVVVEVLMSIISASRQSVKVASDSPISTM